MSVEEILRDVNRSIERTAQNPETVIVRAPGSRGIVLSKHGTLTRAGEKAKTLGWSPPAERILPNARPFMKGTKEFAPTEGGRLVMTRKWEKDHWTQTPWGKTTLWPNVRDCRQRPRDY